MCCGKNSSSATCGHGAGIACMKEETKRIKGKEKKIQKRKMKKGGVARGSQRVPSDNSAERIQGYRTAQQNPG